MSDTEPEYESPGYPCQHCEEGGVHMQPGGDWVCENCGHNYSRPANPQPGSN